MGEYQGIQPIFTVKQLKYILYLAEEDVSLNDEHPEIAHEVIDMIEMYFYLTSKEED